MDTARTALVLIDFQKESQYGIEGLDPAVRSTSMLLDACRAIGIPVIYTRQVNRADSVGLSNQETTDAAGRPVYYTGDTPAVEIIDELAPQDSDIVVDRHRWSGFHATPLDSILRDLDARHLIMGGLVTDGCLMTSVFDAYFRDYQVNLVKDACAATNDGAHKSSILIMANWVYDLEIFNARDVANRLANIDYKSWRADGPDQLQFTGATLDQVFGSLE